MRPEALYDPVPGNRGLKSLGTLLLRLDELDGLMPSDLDGNLDDLAPDSGHTVAPLSVPCWTGPGRAFVIADSKALIAADLPGRDTLLQRDVTIQTIIAIPALAGSIPQQTIISRGTHDGTAGEPYSYGLELFGPGGAGVVGVRFFWEDVGGTIRPDAGVTLALPGDMQFFLLTATRRWESTGKVVCRYYANDQKLGESTSTHGDLAGGTTGHTTLGGRLNAGTWEHFLGATIDELAVGDFEMSAEEVREVYRRLAVYQPAGVAMFTGLVPVGSKWGDDPGNRIGRFVKITGQSLGQGIAAAEEVRALWMPDNATKENIGRWEAIDRLSPGPSDSLDVRRARVLSYEARDQGYSIPAIQAAMASVLDTAAANVQILEFTNEIKDDFTTLATERWLVGDAATWAIVGGALRVTANLGDDLRWEPTRAHATIRTPIPLAEHALSDLEAYFFASAKLVAYTTLPVNTMVGLYVYNRVGNTSLWFGVYKDAGGVKHIGWANFLGSTMGAFTALAAAPAAPLWLRLERISPTGFIHAGDARYRLSWSTVDQDTTADFTSTELQFGFADPEWVGFAAVSTDAALASALSADFDDFRLKAPKGDRPFFWYAYRDPALGGAPDIVGAQNLAQKQKPAHTYAAVIQNKSVLCDDPRDGLCDRGPMGAL